MDKARQSTAFRGLSEELAAISGLLAEGALPLGRLARMVRGQAWFLLVILLALPFLTPLPLPGLSTPLGAAIAFIAFHLMLGRRPWMPRWVGRTVLPRGFFSRVLRLSEGMVRFLGRMSRARWEFVFPHPWVERVHVSLILIAGLILLLPLPIPFTNTFPAWVIVFASCGLLARDGVMIVMAYLTSLLGLVYFLFLGGVTEALFHQLSHWIGWA